MNERSVWPVVLTGILAVVTLDTAGSFFSKSTGFNYEWFAIPSFIIFAAIGFAAGWRHSLSAAAWAGLAVSAVDTTLGWWISWQIGPGAVPLDEEQDYLLVVFTGKLNIALDTLLALGAGAWARRMRRRRGAAQMA